MAHGYTSTLVLLHCDRLPVDGATGPAAEPERHWSFTHFVNGTTSASVGAGITVHAVTVTSAPARRST